MGTEIIITDDGQTWRQPAREKIEVGDELARQLLSDVKVKQFNVVTLPGWGTAHLALSTDGEERWTIPLDRLPLKARYRMTGGVLCPIFKESTEQDPILPLVWPVPDTMRLVLLVKVTALDGGIKYVTLQGYDSSCHLFAIDPQKRYWRIPLSNLFDDCKLCLGNMDFKEKDSLACITKTLDQFKNGQWNSDLADSHSVECQNKMFRFQPENEGFKPLPIDAEDWTTLCKKIGNATTENVCLKP